MVDSMEGSLPFENQDLVCHVASGFILRDWNFISRGRIIFWYMEDFASWCCVGVACSSVRQGVGVFLVNAKIRK